MLTGVALSRALVARDGAASEHRGLEGVRAAADAEGEHERRAGDGDGGRGGAEAGEGDVAAAATGELGGHRVSLR
jgi:hypothetical protein